MSSNFRVRRALTVILILLVLGSVAAWFMNKYFWIEEQALITRIWPAPTVRQIEEQRLRKIAGWFSRDCGHVPHRADADPAITCAREAIKTGQPFYVSFDYVGLDSHGTIGLAANRRHQVYEVSTDELGRGFLGQVATTGTMRTVTVTRCEESPTEQNALPGNRFLSCVWRSPGTMNKRQNELPPDFPQDLASAAFFANNGEAAWPPEIAVSVTRWLGEHGYAVLGTELWVIKANGTICSLPLGNSGLPEVQGNTVNRATGETWDMFTRRAVVETSNYLRSFDPAEIHEAAELRFNITWASEREFQSLCPSP